ncbi:MAG: GAF domain-containing protein [Chloroflexota bacterium]|nr:MAG: GAF domain-containing protein [Chloroflexota bacterium]
MDSDWLLSILERANRIASSSQLDDLLGQMLDLVIDVCEAKAAALCLFDCQAGEMVCRVVRGVENSQKLTGKRIKIERSLAGKTLAQRGPILIEDLDASQIDPIEIGLPDLKRALSIPLWLHDELFGVVQVFNFVNPEIQIVQLLGNRMASELDKALLIQASEQRSERFKALIDIIGRIGSSLDRDQILKMIIESARQLLNAEAGSLFLVDEVTGELVLHFATNIPPEQWPSVRVPPDKGIIGYVARTGETVLVPDTQKDDRYYSNVAQNVGFETRSILAVPLRTRQVYLGGERGSSEERIIGGLEALNKANGTFDAEDAVLLETFANQAATVFQIASLYANTEELFIDVVRAMTAAIDAKDPYTEGHSERVSDFAVAIARELDLKTELIYHIRIAGLLHDVGKIGISDNVLKKPGQLNMEEFEEIKKHPKIGERIMREVRMLQTELAGISQHHEWVDGTGYPSGLCGEGLSLTGRIIAVADVFDAITSDRPYRAAQPANMVLDHLRAETGSHFDRACVEALVRAFQNGMIRVQGEPL